MIIHHNPIMTIPVFNIGVIFMTVFHTLGQIDQVRLISIGPSYFKKKSKMLTHFRPNNQKLWSGRNHFRPKNVVRPWPDRPDRRRWPWFNALLISGNGDHSGLLVESELWSKRSTVQYLPLLWSVLLKDTLTHI